MSNAPVDPAEVPVYTGDLDSLQAKVTSLAQGGTKVKTVGSDVHTSFAGLSAFYKAPEAEQLFAVTEPVARTARALGDDMQTVSKALGTYAQEITPLVDQLNRLKQEAADFRAKDAADDDWDEDGDLIEENLARRNKIAEVWTAFQAAERDCHAKIVALVGGTALRTNDGTNQKGMYGYDAEALKQSKSLPWGDAVEESVPAWQVWEHVYDFGKGVIVDGLWGTVRGLGTLVGVDGWDAAGEAWVNLAKLSTAVTIAAVPGLGAAYLTVPGNMLPSWLRDSRKAMVETGKAMLAWDQWGTNNSRAAGAVTFNVLTALVTRGGGAAVSGAGKAGTAAKALSFAGKVGQVIDPMTYAFKGAGAGVSKIGDVLSHLKNLRGLDLPKFPQNTVALPDGAHLTADGTIRLPTGQKIPEGFTRLPDGTVQPPAHVTLLPPGTVRLPTDGPPRFLAEDGTIHRPDGTVEHHAQTAPRDITSKPTDGADVPRVDSPSHREQPAMAGVGGRGDEVARVGSEVSGPTEAEGRAGHGGNAGDSIPPSRAGSHGAPGNNAGEHMPADNLGHNSTEGKAGGNHLKDNGDSTSGGHGPGNAQDSPPRESHGARPASGHDSSASSDTGFGSSGGPGGGSHGGTHGPGVPDGLPPVHLEGDRVAQQPIGKMAPEQEEAVTTALTESKVPPVDQERMLTQLRKSGYGSAVAEHIASGRFAGFPGYKDLIYQVKQNDMLPAVHQALEHAAELQAKSVENIGFELKIPDQKLDLDVLVRSENGIEYGAQLKDVQSTSGIKSAVSKIAEKQLAGPGVRTKVAILDINDIKGSLTDRILRNIQRAADRTNAYFELRFIDGSLTVFPTNANKP
ncbi:hypothetical protein [Streptomyces sp. NPDC045470]|uniref:hypothetical protein n=1 Tax=Streptomyces sp. NPDC045470 TaxID=3155469 RepID=UPI0033FB1DCD